MKNPDRDKRHSRRRKAGEKPDAPDGKAVAEALYGGTTEALEDDRVQEDTPRLVIKDSNMSGFRTSCALCEERMETRSGPWIFLDTPGNEEVCKPCGRRVDPETVTKLEDKRERYLEHRAS